jgi:antirestriction protein ArdC
MTKAKFDVYQTTTDQIIAALEAGAKPWTNSWKGSPADGLPLRHNGEPYQGINVLVLWCAASANGYASPHWMTFKQAKDLGAAVRKGEKGTVVMYYGSASKDDTETGEAKRFGFAKSFRVFNAEQIEGLADHYTAPPPR